MTVDSIYIDNNQSNVGVADKENVECCWWNGSSFQFKEFAPFTLDGIEDCPNETFKIGDTVTLKSGSPIYTIVEIEGCEVSLEGNSNTFNSWLFKKV